jgi:hypothetical protein
MISLDYRIGEYDVKALITGKGAVNMTEYDQYNLEIVMGQRLIKTSRHLVANNPSGLALILHHTDQPPSIACFLC